MPFIPNEQLPYIIEGLAGCIILWLIFYSITRNQPIVKKAINKTANTREFAISAFNLILVAVGITISTIAISISTGDTKMNPQDLNSLQNSAFGLLHIVYVLIGVAAGAFLIWIIHLIIVVIRERNEQNRQGAIPDFEITISSKKLANLTKEIGDINKVETMLVEFINKVHEKPSDNKETKDK
jgi:hypothetical protein